ncbi:MAG: helix-turn-helix domain-containing protein [Balneolaceae bacterium]|nr:helix-turn-helix domain-containing protein [Balneolaceae bacterium]MDR9407904.1 helix-turn-helix domain-containing protein [Balneolaceae bacterium]
MKFVEQIERLKYLDELIRKGNTGTPDELARRLGISRSQLYNLINYFNDLGVPVKFSRRKNSFYYHEDDKNLEITFSIKIITDEEIMVLQGGSCKIFSASIPQKYDSYYFEIF